MRKGNFYFCLQCFPSAVYGLLRRPFASRAQQKSRFLLLSLGNKIQSCLLTRGLLMCFLGDNKCINLDNYINFISDPKTADWPLVATPWPTVTFVAAYLFIVKVGPKIMETRNAYSLREVLLVYNFSLVLLSAWMTYEVRAAEVSVLL